jgi:hypothetical protein
VSALFNGVASAPVTYSSNSNTLYSVTIPHGLRSSSGVWSIPSFDALILLMVP